MTNESRPLIPVDPKGLDEIAESLLSGSSVNVNPNPTGFFLANATVNPREYYQVPNSSIVIAKAETLKGLDWNKTHEDLQKQKLRMPLVPEFMNHFVNVLNAHKKSSQLLYADGTLVSKSEVEDLYRYLTTNHRSGCWTWLDAKFEETNGIWQVKYAHRFNNGNLIAGKTEKLENCLREDCFVELDFTKQGLPIKKSATQEYHRGSNIQYWHPRKDSVARFNADSDRAVLYCGRVPTNTNASLGVFACAEKKMSN